MIQVRTENYVMEVYKHYRTVETTQEVVDAIEEHSGKQLEGFYKHIVMVDGKESKTYYTVVSDIVQYIKDTHGTT